MLGARKGGAAVRHRALGVLGAVHEPGAPGPEGGLHAVDGAGQGVLLPQQPQLPRQEHVYGGPRHQRQRLPRNREDLRRGPPPPSTAATLPRALPAIPRVLPPEARIHENSP